MHGSMRRGLETEHPAMVTAVKRPAGETRGKVAAGPKRRAMPPRQPPTLQRNRSGHPGFIPRTREHPGRHAEETRPRRNGRGAPVEEVSPKITSYGRLHVIAYRATLDVPRELAQFVAQLLLAERRRRAAIDC